MRAKQVVGFVVVIAAALAVAGCDSENKGKIEGTKWSSNAGTIKGQKLASGKLELEFYKDGTMDFSGTDFTGTRRVLTGRYSLGLGNLVVLHMDKELAGMKDHAESVTITKGELTMRDSDGTTLVFSRVK